MLFLLILYIRRYAQKSEINAKMTEPMDNEGLFEGCGREGPIRAIFLSEFHHIAGPKIVVQYPPDTIPKEIFDSLSTYIIPKTHLQRLSMTVNALGKKIIGYPIQIKNDKYERNAFYFNTCFPFPIYKNFSGAARVNLNERVEAAFGWTPERLIEFRAARKRFPDITYKNTDS